MHGGRLAEPVEATGKTGYRARFFDEVVGDPSALRVLAMCGTSRGRFRRVRPRSAATPARRYGSAVSRPVSSPEPPEVQLRGVQSGAKRYQNPVPGTVGTTGSGSELPLPPKKTVKG
jgi:hypothetical protein